MTKVIVPVYYLNYSYINSDQENAFTKRVILDLI